MGKALWEETGRLELVTVAGDYNVDQGTKIQLAQNIYDLQSLLVAIRRRCLRSTRLPKNCRESNCQPCAQLSRELDLGITSNSEPHFMPQGTAIWFCILKVRSKYRTKNKRNSSWKLGKYVRDTTGSILENCKIWVSVEMVPQFGHPAGPHAIKINGLTTMATCKVHAWESFHMVAVPWKYLYNSPTCLTYYSIYQSRQIHCFSAINYEIRQSKTPSCLRS